MLFFAVLFCFLLLPVFIKLIQLLVSSPRLSKYTEPVSVKCTDLLEIKITKTELDSSPNSHYHWQNRRKVFRVMRPSFSGFYNGRTLTFCRKKDLQQPVVEIGNNYTIYVKPDSMDCHDYYEEHEIQFLCKKHKRNILLFILTLLFMILWIVSTVYISAIPL